MACQDHRTEQPWVPKGADSEPTLQLVLAEDRVYRPEMSIEVKIAKADLLAVTEAASK